jgi:hypothetical protein
LLPLASPSSGVFLIWNASLKTFETSTETNSLGPILGERAETVGRHRLFVGFSYQFFDFDKIDGISLNNFPAIYTHAVDTTDNPGHTCGIASGQGNLNGCAFVRDAISTANSISLKVNQYTSYLTFGLTRRVDVSLVIPVENVRMGVASVATIIPGTNGLYPEPGNPTPTVPFFPHLFGNCTTPTTPTADPNCLNHTFPDFTFSQGGSVPKSSVTGIGDIVARVKGTIWEGERAGFAAGVDVRFPTGDAINYLGSGAYGVKPFAVFSYRARVAPHVLVGYEWNGNSITAGDVIAGVKAGVPNDFVYSAGADSRLTKWLTGSFDIVGQRIFGTETLSVTSQPFLAFCGKCTAAPTPNTIQRDNLTIAQNQSYNITNASMGIKLRPFGRVSKLVLTANVLVRLDEGGLGSKAAPLVGIGYTF